MVSRLAQNVLSREETEETFLKSVPGDNAQLQIVYPVCNTWHLDLVEAHLLASHTGISQACTRASTALFRRKAFDAACNALQLSGALTFRGMRVLPSVNWSQSCLACYLPRRGKRSWGFSSRQLHQRFTHMSQSGQ